MIPEFAILGHPNEGKSSVLSTLTEDDSVRISAEPGETVTCRTFPVRIDDKEIIRFTDTPGFQNPGRMLSLLRAYDTAATDPLERFYEEYAGDDSLAHDCELLRPLLRGAGIIYVADGSRPLRQVDLQEMEILRLSGKPRMAVLNCKREEQDHIDQWKEQFRRHFNSSRVFNAHRATYRDRIALFEALKSIEQDWQEVLGYVVSTFKDDWHNRNSRTAELICELIHHAVSFKMEKTLPENAPLEPAKKILFERYRKELLQSEHRCHQRMKMLFKHSRFDVQLPAQSILHQDLFSDATWEFLGLKKNQLALAGGAGGAALAAGIDLAAGGASLGFFTTLGGALGALGAVYGSKNLASKIKVMGFGTARVRLQIGPNTNPQFPFILLDRSLLYYSHITNWAHGRRDYEAMGEEQVQGALSRTLPKATLREAGRHLRRLRQQGVEAGTAAEGLNRIIVHQLNLISGALENEADYLQ